MLIKPIDVKFFQQHQRKVWMKDLYPKDGGWVPIDKIINGQGKAHALPSRRDLAVHNSVALLKLVRKNLINGNRYDKKGSLAQYMLDYQQQDGRLPIYKRWVRNLMRRIV